MPTVPTLEDDQRTVAFLALEDDLWRVAVLVEGDLTQTEPVSPDVARDVLVTLLPVIFEPDIIADDQLITMLAEERDDARGIVRLVPTNIGDCQRLVDALTDMGVANINLLAAHAVLRELADRKPTPYRR